MAASSGKFVGRAGDKLAWALDGFGIDVAGWTCADFGCNVGGFTHCLLSRGAAKVYAVDTGYGFLAWALRKDPRVVVMERTNALYAPPEPGGVDLVAIDVAWTPQRLIVPAARAWLRGPQAGAGVPAARAWLGPAQSGAGGGVILSLLKPHYELAKLQGGKPRSPLDLPTSREVCLTVCRQLHELGCTVQAICPSAVIGKGGNLEYLLLIRPSAPFLATP